MAYSLYLGEYIRRDLPEGGGELKNIWTGERWILEADDCWMGGPYFERDGHAYSFRNPELKIELSARAISLWSERWMLGQRAVYHDDDDGAVRDAITDAALFPADFIWPCEAGFAVRFRGTLRFTDGVREDLPLGYIGWNEYVMFLRVSETEYSLKVGYYSTGYHYFLLDTAKWTAIRI